MTERPARRLKVLVLGPPLQAVGGIQNYVQTLFAALQNVVGEDGVRIVAVPGEPEQRDDGSFALRPFVKLRFLASAIAAAISWTPDLIICAHIGVAPAGRIIQKLTRIPYWVILYGIEVWGELSLSKQRALRAAQRLVSITRFTLGATIARHSLDNPRALILPPTLPKENTPLSATARTSSDDAQPPMVLTVGRVASSERYKGHDVMLEAWPSVLRRLPDALYWIAGGGDDLPRLEAKARELGIAASVRFAGPVSSDELAVCYHRCSVFAMPARTELDARAPRGEGFGIVYLEAMARGKPVVGPRVGAPAEFIRDGEHGLLVDPASANELAGALIELLADPERARRMGEAARQFVTSEFSFESFCRRLREGLQE
ncbi:MAG TPA: glycosyltransferase family 4 protein [Candidatus Dormibacteraeota bacterium]|nr:glycosyltransferase family 4 protein [Candidatus Dormibacteraeota bacterium]